MNQPQQKNTLNCPICGAQEFIDFFQAKDIPAQDGVVWPTQDSAINAQIGEINLVCCHQCSYIFNKAHDSQKITFLDYDFSLHYSSTYQQFNKAVIENLIKRHHLQHKTILDVGCGKGHFLVELCQSGHNKGIGIDPSYEHPPGLIYDPEQVTFIKDYFTERYSNLSVDFIACRHVIDELERPVDFLTLLKSSLRENPHSAIYLEIPNALKTFSESLIWNIGYAKRSWFTPYSIIYLLQLAGYKAVNVEEVLGGDYLAIDAYPDFSSGDFKEIELDKPFQYFQNFAISYQNGLQKWKQVLDNWAEKKYSIALWGAGMRGVNFLSHFSAIENLALVIDINPLRQGKFLPKSGYLVSPPVALKDQAVDVILISNATYKNEIISQARDLGFSGHFEVF